MAACSSPASRGRRAESPLHRTALVAIVACLLAVAAGTVAPAHASERVRGIVLSVLPAREDVVVRHDAFGAMPAMTMVFHLAPSAARAELRAGDRIDARVDQAGGAFVLDDVHVLAGAPVTPPPSAIRNVRFLQIGDRMPDTRFVDQAGKPFTFADFRGKKVVLAFVYTRCRDPRMCPLVSSNFHTLQQRIGTQPYHLVEITLDPAYDTPPVLTKYAALFGQDPSRWTLGTGPPNVVLDFAAQFGIEPFPDPRIGLIHTERTTLIDTHGRIVDFLDDAAWNADDVIARLQAIDSVPANPLARLDYELSKAAVAVCGNSAAGVSGLADLAVVLAILAGAAWLLYRLANRIFREQN